MIQKGYELDSKDKDFGIITTKPKASNQVLSSYAYYYKFIVQENLIEISGMLSIGSFGIDGDLNLTYQETHGAGTFSPVENRGMGGSPLKDAFDKMMDFTTQIQSQEINYLVKFQQ